MVCAAAHNVHLHVIDDTQLKEKRDKELLVLETDACLFEDEAFRCVLASAASASYCPSSLLQHCTFAQQRKIMPRAATATCCYCHVLPCMCNLHYRPYAEKYALDQAAFFEDYAAAHAKLSELGVEWEAGGPVTI